MINAEHISKNILNSLLNNNYSKHQSKINNSLTLQYSLINTTLGTMIAVADEESLYMLDFLDNNNLERKIKTLIKQIGKSKKANVNIINANTHTLNSISAELDSYFAGSLKQFKTPIYLTGTSFQQLAWNELIKTTYGSTKSYISQSTSIGKGTAYRAVANANGANPLIIIVPCHRIIKNNGKLGGYSCGIERKNWLLEHENKNN